ncbi:hypothetical protein CHARACLAT_011584 [Characodon lateralis]|uniref:Uncharacterized protein n=1 Tax=Characodon lateralis TaxID=208331 RepID=A0ABU7E8Y5_9TELE|nr:hypothetical protein [Characodon lateralis]
MAGAKCLLKTPSNFQSSAMFEGSESGEVEGGCTESTVVSSISACKRVLCSNSVLDSCEYWLKNEKTLCRLGLLDEDADTSCTLVQFWSLQLPVPCTERLLLGGTYSSRLNSTRTSTSTPDSLPALSEMVL